MFAEEKCHDVVSLFLNIHTDAHIESCLHDFLRLKMIYEHVAIKERYSLRQ